MAAGRLNLAWVQGTPLRSGFVARTGSEDGPVRDLSGWSAVLTVLRRPTDLVPLLVERTPESEVLSLDGASGTVRIDLPADWSLSPPAWRGVWTLDLVRSDGTVIHFVEGKWAIRQRTMGGGDLVVADDGDLGLIAVPTTEETSVVVPESDVPDIDVLDPRLGRVPEFDERSRSFPMRAALEAAPKTYRPRSYTWSVGAHLDQGPNPSCVGFAWTHELLARPAVVDADAAFAAWVYRTAQRYDAWSGENYEGTSVIAGAKVIQQRPPRMNEGRGLIGEYRWIFGDMGDLEKTLGYFGPVIFGTWWYEGMFRPNGDGIIRPTGARAGGHAYLVTGIHVREKLLRVHNSWGSGWGVGGDAFLSYDDALRLLHEDGECCVPMRRLQLVD